MFLDMAAKRYGVRPSELLGGGVMYLLFDLAVAKRGIDEDNKNMGEAAKKGFFCPMILR